MRKFLICSGLLMAMCYSSIARAQVGPFNVTFDEYGNSIGGLTSFVGADPTGGVAGNVLIYLLPRVVTGGDIRVWEDFVGGTLSDVLRFTNASGVFNGSLTADRFVFYSLAGGGAPADSGLPAVLSPNDGGVGALEQGPPGNRHFDWLPGGVFDNQYHGISEGRLALVPEPGSVGMLAGITVPGIIVFVIRRRRN